MFEKDEYQLFSLPFFLGVLIKTFDQPTRQGIAQNLQEWRLADLVNEESLPTGIEESEVRRVLEIYQRMLEEFD